MLRLTEFNYHSCVFINTTSLSVRFLGKLFHANKNMTKLFITSNFSISFKMKNTGKKNIYVAVVVTLGDVSRSFICRKKVSEIIIAVSLQFSLCKQALQSFQTF